MNVKQPFGLWSGVGLVIADMVGAGVFLSAGFMAQDLPPGPLLLAWVVGAALALSGVLAYAEVARLVPRSGGEYRYVSVLLHPALGYLAGWASLLVGFSAPVAIDAAAAGAFASRLFPGLDSKWVAVALIVLLTTVHLIGLRVSARTQNLLVVVKLGLLAAFVGVGLTQGSTQWPTWAPAAAAGAAQDVFPWAPFVGSLFFIAFAFSGWNAATYAAEEFKEPARDVPRAMLIGCCVVAVAYLVINFIFVANLLPSDATVVFNYDKFVATPGAVESQSVTVGHAVMERLIGPWGARAMSVGIVLAFISAMSAMMLIGPRVYAAMARDGYLPKALAGKDGKPPVGAVLLQGALSLVLVFTHSLKETLSNVGAILTLFAALTAAGLFRAYLSPLPGMPKPRVTSLVAAGVYAASAAYMLYFGFRGDNSRLLLWVGAVSVLALGGYWVTRGKAKAVVASG